MKQKNYIDILLKEKQEINEETRELIQRVKSEQKDKEYLVDRRIVNRFLVNYFHPELSGQAKHQMLESLARIL